jgi:hypothetical protein
MQLVNQRRASGRAATRNTKVAAASTRRRSPPIERQIVAIADLLQSYADRGVFRGCSEPRRHGHRIEFTIVWHYDRPCRFVVDTRARTVSFPDLLPDMQSGSLMMKELREFLASATSSELPVHRRIDPKRGMLRASVRDAHAQLTMRVMSSDYEYCARRLVHVAQEVFIVFLREGPYYDYRVESLGVDPDAEWA